MYKILKKNVVNNSACVITNNCWHLALLKVFVLRIKLFIGYVIIMYIFEKNAILVPQNVIDNFSW